MTGGRAAPAGGGLMAAGQAVAQRVAYLSRPG
jgi:hypothetical protein